MAQSARVGGESVGAVSAGVAVVVGDSVERGAGFGEVVMAFARDIVESVNAFAAGINGKGSALAVSRGAVAGGQAGKRAPEGDRGETGQAFAAFQRGGLRAEPRGAIPHGAACGGVVRGESAQALPAGKGLGLDAVESGAVQRGGAQSAVVLHKAGQALQTGKGSVGMAVERGAVADGQAFGADLNESGLASAASAGVGVCAVEFGASGGSGAFAEQLVESGGAGSALGGSAAGVGVAVFGGTVAQGLALSADLQMSGEAFAALESVADAVLPGAVGDFHAGAVFILQVSGEALSAGIGGNADAIVGGTIQPSQALSVGGNESLQAFAAFGAAG